MNKFEDLFFLGLDRMLMDLLPVNGPLQIDLGASGKKVAPGAIPLGLPQWSFPRDRIPYHSGTIDVVHAYHFMEHLPGETAIDLLIEIERVLKPGGVFQFCIPWAKAEIAYQDLTHKSFWTESSFRMLFRNPYYEPRAHTWKLREHYLVLAGIVERNICLLGQLVKGE